MQDQSESFLHRGCGIFKLVGEVGVSPCPHLSSSSRICRKGDLGATDPEVPSGCSLVSRVTWLFQLSLPEQVSAEPGPAFTRKEVTGIRPSLRPCPGMLVFALPHRAAVRRTEDAALGMACGVGNGRPWALVLSLMGQPDLLETPTRLEFWDWSRSWYKTVQFFIPLPKRPALRRGGGGEPHQTPNPEHKPVPPGTRVWELNFDLNPRPSDFRYNNLSL